MAATLMTRPLIPVARPWNRFGYLNLKVVPEALSMARGAERAPCSPRSRAREVIGRLAC